MSINGNRQDAENGCQKGSHTCVARVLFVMPWLEGSACTAESTHMELLCCSAGVKLLQPSVLPMRLLSPSTDAKDYTTQVACCQPQASCHISALCQGLSNMASTSVQLCLAAVLH